MLTRTATSSRNNHIENITICLVYFSICSKIRGLTVIIMLNVCMRRCWSSQTQQVTGQVLVRPKKEVGSILITISLMSYLHSSLWGSGWSVNFCFTSHSTTFQLYMWRHIDVQADWISRSWTYGRTPLGVNMRGLLVKLHLWVEEIQGC